MSTLETLTKIFLRTGGFFKTSKSSALAGRRACRFFQPFISMRSYRLTPGEVANYAER